MDPPKWVSVVFLKGILREEYFGWSVLHTRRQKGSGGKKNIKKINKFSQYSSVTKDWIDQAAPGKKPRFDVISGIKMPRKLLFLLTLEDLGMRIVFLCHT